MTDSQREKKQSLALDKQSRVYAQWINNKLSKRGLTVGSNLEDLCHDLKSGIILYNLLEEITGDKLADIGGIGKLSKGETVNHLSSNVTLVLRYLQMQGVDLTNIGASDVVSGNPRVVFWLLWRIMLFSFASDLGDKGQDANAVKLKSVAWLKLRIKHCAPGLEVTDVTSSLRDGRVLLAVLHDFVQGRQGPRCCLLLEDGPFKPSGNAKKDLETAMRELHSRFGVGPLICSIEDCADDKVTLPYIMLLKSRTPLPLATRDDRGHGEGHPPHGEGGESPSVVAPALATKVNVENSATDNELRAASGQEKEEEDREVANKRMQVLCGGSELQQEDAQGVSCGGDGRGGSGQSTGSSSTFDACHVTVAAGATLPNGCFGDEVDLGGIGGGGVECAADDCMDASQTSSASLEGGRSSGEDLLWKVDKDYVIKPLSPETTSAASDDVDDQAVRPQQQFPVGGDGSGGVGGSGEGEFGDQDNDKNDDGSDSGGSGLQRSRGWLDISSDDFQDERSSGSPTFPVRGGGGVAADSEVGCGVGSDNGDAIKSAPVKTVFASSLQLSLQVQPPSPLSSACSSISFSSLFRKSAIPEDEAVCHADTIASFDNTPSLSNSIIPCLYCNTPKTIADEGDESTGNYVGADEQREASADSFGEFGAGRERAEAAFPSPLLHHNKSSYSTEVAEAASGGGDCSILLESDRDNDEPGNRLPSSVGGGSGSGSDTEDDNGQHLSPLDKLALLTPKGCSKVCYSRPQSPDVDAVSMQPCTGGPGRLERGRVNAATGSIDDVSVSSMSSHEEMSRLPCTGGPGRLERGRVNASSPDEMASTAMLPNTREPGRLEQSRMLAVTVSMDSATEDEIPSIVMSPRMGRDQRLEQGRIPSSMSGTMSPLSSQASQDDTPPLAIPQSPKGPGRLERGRLHAATVSMDSTALTPTSSHDEIMQSIAMSPRTGGPWRLEQGRVLASTVSPLTSQDDLSSRYARLRQQSRTASPSASQDSCLLGWIPPKRAPGSDHSSGVVGSGGAAPDSQPSPEESFPHSIRGLVPPPSPDVVGSDGPARVSSRIVAAPPSAPPTPVSDSSTSNPLRVAPVLGRTDFCEDVERAVNLETEVADSRVGTATASTTRGQEKVKETIESLATTMRKRLARVNLRIDASAPLVDNPHSSPSTQPSSRHSSKHSSSSPLAGGTPEGEGQQTPTEQPTSHDNPTEQPPPAVYPLSNTGPSLTPSGLPPLPQAFFPLNNPQTPTGEPPKAFFPPSKKNPSLTPTGRPPLPQAFFAPNNSHTPNGEPPQAFFPSNNSRTPTGEPPQAFFPPSKKNPSLTPTGRPPQACFPLNYSHTPTGEPPKAFFPPSKKNPPLTPTGRPPLPQTFFAPNNSHTPNGEPPQAFLAPSKKNHSLTPTGRPPQACFPSNNSRTPTGEPPQAFFPPSKKKPSLTPAGRPPRAFFPSNNPQTPTGEPPQAFFPPSKKNPSLTPTGRPPQAFFPSNNPQTPTGEPPQAFFPPPNTNPSLTPTGRPPQAFFPPSNTNPSLAPTGRPPQVFFPSNYSHTPTGEPPQAYPSLTPPDTPPLAYFPDPVIPLAAPPSETFFDCDGDGGEGANGSGGDGNAPVPSSQTKDLLGQPQEQHESWSFLTTPPAQHCGPQPAKAAQTATATTVRLPPPSLSTTASKPEDGPPCALSPMVRGLLELRLRCCLDAGSGTVGTVAALSVEKEVEVEEEEEEEEGNSVVVSAAAAAGNGSSNHLIAQTPTSFVAEKKLSCPPDRAFVLQNLNRGDSIDEDRSSSRTPSPSDALVSIEEGGVGEEELCQRGGRGGGRLIGQKKRRATHVEKEKKMKEEQEKCGGAYANEEDNEEEKEEGGGCLSTRLLNWSAERPLDRWERIAFDEDESQVLALDLGGSNLSLSNDTAKAVLPPCTGGGRTLGLSGGTLHPEARIQVLRLHDNPLLCGDLEEAFLGGSGGSASSSPSPPLLLHPPPAFSSSSSCSHLRVLWLQGTSLRGNLPNALTHCSLLRHCFLDATATADNNDDVENGDNSDGKDKGATALSKATTGAAGDARASVGTGGRGGLFTGDVGLLALCCPLLVRLSVVNHLGVCGDLEHALSRLRKLKEADFSGTSVGGDVFKALLSRGGCSFSRLERLSVSGKAVSGDASQFCGSGGSGSGVSISCLGLLKDLRLRHTSCNGDLAEALRCGALAAAVTAAEARSVVTTPTATLKAKEKKKTKKTESEASKHTSKHEHEGNCDNETDVILAVPLPKLEWLNLVGSFGFFEQTQGELGGGAPPTTTSALTSKEKLRAVAAPSCAIFGPH